MKIEDILSSDELKKLQQYKGGQQVYVPKPHRASNNLIKARYNKLLNENNLRHSVIVLKICEEYELTLRNAYRILRDE